MPVERRIKRRTLLRRAIGLLVMSGTLEGMLTACFPAPPFIKHLDSTAADYATEVFKVNDQYSLETIFSQRTEYIALVENNPNGTPSTHVVAYTYTPLYQDACQWIREPNSGNFVTYEIKAGQIVSAIETPAGPFMPMICE